MTLPALYIGHGAPMLLDDSLWTSQLSQIATNLEKPKAILIVSAHWESAPITLRSPNTLIDGYFMGQASDHLPLLNFYLLDLIRYGNSYLARLCVPFAG